VRVAHSSPHPTSKIENKNMVVYHQLPTVRLKPPHNPPLPTLVLLLFLFRCVLGGNTEWKHRVKTQSGNTAWKHRVETQHGNTAWKHRVETQDGNN